MACFRTRFQSKTRDNPFYSIFNPLQIKELILPQTLKMVSSQAKSKRPICPSCSKPARICLCNRILTPGIENSVGVTILQHSLESKHPLNSTRIARLGLKNLNVATVSDVNFEAQFLIWLREPNSELGVVQKYSEILETQKSVGENIDTVDSGNKDVENSKTEPFLKYPAEQNEKLISSGGECSAIPSTQNPAKGVKVVVYSEIGMGDELVSDSEAGSPAVNKCSGTTGSIALETPAKFLGNQNDEDMVSASFTLNEAVGIGRGYGKPAIAATIGKYGVVSSLSHTWMPQSQSQELNFNNSLACAEAREALLKGFVVKKLQKKKLHGSFELEEHEEFELEVPPGSVLLFPSDKAIDVNTFEAIGFKVKHLIVLDGTWAKAKRIYSESPWLEILPHLKLEMNKMSLYSEVRQQPKAGYLSTIESIVYALKAIGENHKGLDNLLDAFESMVGDQRRCKDERLSKLSPL